MTDAELNAATEGLQFMLDGYRDKNSWEGYPRMLRDGIAAITTLRAQLAEAREVSEAGKIAIRNKALDAASEYVQQVYGSEWTFLSNPVDRERILALIEKEKTK